MPHIRKTLNTLMFIAYFALAPHASHGQTDDCKSRNCPLRSKPQSAIAQQPTVMNAPKHQVFYQPIEEASTRHIAIQPIEAAATRHIAIYNMTTKQHLMSAPHWIAASNLENMNEEQLLDLHDKLHRSQNHTSSTQPQQARSTAPMQQVVRTSDSMSTCCPTSSLGKPQNDVAGVPATQHIFPRRERRFLNWIRGIHETN